MSKRSSRSAVYIGSFWNKGQHRRMGPGGEDWEAKAKGFVRGMCRQARSRLEEHEKGQDSPLASLQSEAREEYRSRALRSEARASLSDARDALAQLSEFRAEGLELLIRDVRDLEKQLVRISSSRSAS